MIQADELCEVTCVFLDWIFYSPMCGQTGDGKTEYRHFSNQWTEMDWNGCITVGKEMEKEMATHSSILA